MDPQLTSETQSAELVLLPVKGLGSVKARLAGLLSLEERRALVLAMLDDVIRAVAGGGLSCGVLSPDVDVLEFAAARGARALVQAPIARSLNTALESAVRGGASGPSRVLVLLPDVPLVTPSEVLAMVRGCEAGARFGAAGAETILLAPDRARRGTNALSIPLPSPIPMRFGRGSLTRHKREAAAVGATLNVVDLAGVALDLDAPEDLRSFLAVDSETRTRVLLDRIGVARRL